MDKIEKERASHTTTHTHTDTPHKEKKQRTFGLNIRNKSKYPFIKRETISIQSLRKKTIFVLDHRLKIGIQRDVYINNDQIQSNGTID